jgi:hypothetical protein
MNSLWVEDIQLYTESPSSNKAWLKPDNYIMHGYKEDRPRAQDLSGSDRSDFRITDTRYPRRG